MALRDDGFMFAGVDFDCVCADWVVRFLFKESLAVSALLLLGIAAL